MPTLLVVGIVALALCGLVATLLSAIDFYRLVVLRPVVDIALFTLLFAAVAAIGGVFGPLP